VGALEGAAAVGEGVHRPAVRGQIADEQLDDVGVVLDDEGAAGHAASFYASGVDAPRAADV
jgi:hypothetical protein